MSTEICAFNLFIDFAQSITSQRQTTINYMAIMLIKKKSGNKSRVSAVMERFYRRKYTSKHTPPTTAIIISSVPCISYDLVSGINNNGELYIRLLQTRNGSIFLKQIGRNEHLCFVQSVSRFDRGEPAHATWHRCCLDRSEVKHCLIFIVSFTLYISSQ